MSVIEWLAFFYGLTGFALSALAGAMLLRMLYSLEAFPFLMGSNLGADRTKQGWADHSLADI